MKRTLKSQVLASVQVDGNLVIGGQIGPMTTVDAVVGGNSYRKRALFDLEVNGFVRFIASDGSPTIVCLTVKGMESLR